MKETTVTKYARTSPLVRKYSFDDEGVPTDWPYSDVLNTSASVVLIDTLLRKHYTTLSMNELTLVTGLDSEIIGAELNKLTDISIIKQTADGYQIDTDDAGVQELRDKQTNLL